MTTATAGTQMYQTTNFLDTRMVVPGEKCKGMDNWEKAALEFLKDGLPMTLSLDGVNLPEDIKMMIMQLNGSTPNAATAVINNQFKYNLKLCDYKTLLGHRKAMGD